MLQTKGYAVQNATLGFEPFSFERRDLSARDVLIEIQFCGVCHSDIHQARNEWQNSIYPIYSRHGFRAARFERVYPSAEIKRRDGAGRRP